MQIIKIEHNDFKIIVECKKLQSLIEKASKKHADLSTASSYKINDGNISVYNIESGKFNAYSNGIKINPLFFENTEYHIGIVFKKDKDIKFPHIYSKLKDISAGFSFNEELGYLSGTINFGNDLGKSELNLHYQVQDENKEINFQFEVFPIKLDYRSDYEKMVADIEKEYTYLTLDFLKKTYSSFTVSNKTNIDIIWWQIFESIYEEIIKWSKHILNKPHKRIIKKHKYVNADRIKKWSANLEEQFVQFKHLPNKTYKIDYEDLSVNITENIFFKHVVFQTLNRYKRIKKLIENRYEQKITNDFKDKLENIQKQLEKIALNPFFRTIDNFRGIKQESLVLQKAAGYSSIYKYWLMLKSGLKFLDSLHNIELKNVAELYQFWCFLELKNIIQELPTIKTNVTQLHDNESNIFISKIIKGRQSKVSFISEHNGNKIDLYHDFSYSTSNNRLEKSFTVNQRPDIVLKITKNDLKNNYVFSYLFDAKYRLASDEIDQEADLPTEDSINQMHRYRDAIYHVNTDGVPEKEIIGAYILFPGAGKREEIENLEYYKSIKTINIGAFPLRPNDSENRELLKTHLKTIINSKTESIINDVISHKGTTLTF